MIRDGEQNQKRNPQEGKDLSLCEDSMSSQKTRGLIGIPKNLRQILVRLDFILAERKLLNKTQLSLTQNQYPKTDGNMHKQKSIFKKHPYSTKSKNSLRMN